ncbi:hypothetical protein KUW09_12990 [Mameliella alba]|nr:hypothetical protein [Antarctobacter heliothermus]MBY6144967.1 hypothetical protein [Mameliella alba]MCA0955955.1 hypothetical protein [Mameliella alba]
MVDLENDPVLKLTFKTLRLLPRAATAVEELAALHVFPNKGIVQKMSDRLFQKKVFRERDLSDLNVINGFIHEALNDEWTTETYWSEGMSETACNPVRTPRGADIYLHGTKLFELEDVLENLLTLLEAEDVAMQLRTGETPYK